ncbi:hypothetical protein [Streptomyces sp. MJM1172]|uniref:hypothetical protein n=1 Tax=Streptomyces sp. MJM1172 TaxID=1703926 RepID=UPI00093AEE9B|nr:hypothetical protein [Streptomyces sp. MJM1172]
MSEGSPIEAKDTQLHRDIAWREGESVVGGRRRTGAAPCAVEASGHGLVLLPSVFAWPDVLVDRSPVTAASIRYPALGIGLFWEPDRPTRDGLAAVLGATRAAPLAALAEPLTTPAPAARPGVTPARSPSTWAPCAARAWSPRAGPGGPPCTCAPPARSTS